MNDDHNPSGVPILITLPNRTRAEAIAATQAVVKAIYASRPAARRAS